MGALGQITIRLLGGLALEHEGTALSGPATRRRPLALLALLACAEARGLAREQLLIYLWPESNTRRARNSLNQTLYGIRQHLGEDVVLGTTTLRLNPERVACDLWEYREALKRGDLATAIRLREGELLETFTLPGVPEFEQWLASERAREARAFRDALERVARGAAKAGDQRAATAYWKWLAVEEPLSARVAQECILALAASGDVTGALAHAQAHADRVRAELGTEPTDVLLLATEIRNRLVASDSDTAVATIAGPDVKAAAAHSSPVRAEPAYHDSASDASSILPVPVSDAINGAPRRGSVIAPEPPRNGAAHVPVSRAETAADPSAEATPETDAEARDPHASSRPLPSDLLLHRALLRRSAKRLRAVLVTVGVVLPLLAAVALWWVARVPPGTADPAAINAEDTQSLLVFPFAVYGGEDAQHLSAALPSLLVSGLDGAGGLRAAGLGVGGATTGRPLPDDGTEQLEQEAARRGVDFYITGEVVVSGSRLRVRASLHRPGSEEPLATSRAEGVSSDLFAIADNVALDLLQEWQGAALGRTLRPSALTTASLPALRAHLMGEAALRADRYSDAIDAFREAIKEDSTFALAYYRLSVAADLAANAALAREAADQAIHYAAELPERERLLISALQALRAGKIDLAEALYRRVADEYPSDPEGWFGLGEVLFHHGPLRGQSVTAARAAFERVLQLDSTDAEALIHLARIAFLEERNSEADALVQRARLIVPDSAALEVRAVRAFALGDRPGLKYVTRQLLARPPHVPAATAIQVAVYQDDLTGAENFARTLLDPGEARITRGFGHRLLAQTALARGQLARAERELAAAAAIDPVPTLELRSLYATFPVFSFSRSTVTEVLNALEAWQPVEIPADSLHTAAHAGLHEHIRLHRLGVLRLALGDTAGAAEAVAALQHVRGDERSIRLARTLAWSLRARSAAAANRPHDALAMLDSADWAPAAEVFVAEVADRFLRAELLEQIGRSHDALRWYESIAQRAIYELVYLAPSVLRQAVIHDHLGNRAEALQQYRRFVELWRDCDPELRPVLRSAERRIAELTAQS